MSDVEMQVADMVGPEAGSAGFVIEEPIARPHKVRPENDDEVGIVALDAIGRLV